MTTKPSEKRFLPKPATMRENITGYLFISPAMIIIATFGLFPIGYAVYMSLFRWRVKQGDYRGLQNYLDIVGDWDGALLFATGFFLLIFAYWLWTAAFKPDPTVEKTRNDNIKQVLTMIVLGLLGIVTLWRGTENSGQADTFLFYLIGICLVGVAIAEFTQFFNTKRDTDTTLLKLIPAIALLGISLFSIIYGYERMIGDAKNEEFLEGLIVTFYYAFASVPIQLSLALILAYILYQNIKGKELFRMIFFMPYITPTVASAVVFRTIFDRDSTSLANRFIQFVGFDPQEWLYEPKPFLQTMFGIELDGFLAGPSTALVSIVLLGIWMYVGYNTVIFLAGLGSIPGDLYEAAKVDGATDWHLFRHITLPLLSPITFYLSILAFIGTFKAFNTIYVMRLPQARQSVDTASIVVFDTFKVDREYGLATAQAIILFFIILAITQVQRNIFEKRVFYG